MTNTIEIRGYCGDRYFARDGYETKADALAAMQLAFDEPLVVAKADDGWYVYADEERAERDQTGERAMAVICQSEDCEDENA